MQARQIYIYFVGAGPGDPELITVKGQRLVREAKLIVYAGSLVPWEIFTQASQEAEIIDSSNLTLAETHALLANAAKNKDLAVRLHTGDPSLYGTIREQMHLLDKEGFNYAVVPGVTSAFAAAAKARVSFTLPEKTQSLIISRISGRTKVPEKEKLQSLAKHGASLAIYLSAVQAEEVVRELIQGGYPEETPAVVAYQVGWPGEKVVPVPLREIPRIVLQENIKKQTVFLVLPGQDEEPFFSRLYSPDFSHAYRQANRH